MNKLYFIIFILDLQTINITLRILHRPRAELLPKIFANLGLDYEERSQFDAIELITQRTLISQRISELLIERAAQFGLLLDDISITHIILTQSFVRGWGNPFHLQEIFTYRREKIG
ncbi:unnamed protein product, partial [Rotaria sordida]